MKTKGCNRFVLLPEFTYNWENFREVDGTKHSHKELKITWLGLDFSIIFSKFK